jgi:hypothetical protein
VPLQADALRRALTGKLGFINAGSGRGNHEKYKLEHDGRYVAHTMVSRGRHDIGDALLAVIANQLGISRQQLYDAVDCRMTREAYLAVVLQP